MSRVGSGGWKGEGGCVFVLVLRSVRASEGKWLCTRISGEQRVLGVRSGGRARA